MTQDITNQLWYQGKQLRTPGRKFLGFIVVDPSKDKTHGQRYRVRIPAIHGYCDLNDQNCEDEKVTKRQDLPLAVVHSSMEAGLQQEVSGSGNGRFDAGNWVLIEFRDPENLKDPVIVAKDSAPNPIYGDKNKFSALGQYVPSTLIKPNENSKVAQATGAFNGCTEVVTDAQMHPANGVSAQNADKCGQGAVIKDSFAANIADFLKIIQDTDGKIGSSFVDKYTGELFEITNYITQYTSAISSLFRNAIGWIKAQITKYVRKAIDLLVKQIMRPIKGVTKVVNETIEKILEMVGCTFGNLDALISNLIESLLNYLVDQTLDAIFGCLDALVDGILNEILSEITSLIDSILSAFSSIAGLIAGFGDLFGEAINAILEFLGISCGGSNPCGSSDTFISKFNTPGEYGAPSSITRSLNSGLGAINNLSNSIAESTAAANEAADNAARGIDLGTTTYDSANTGNSALNQAFNTATQLLGPAASSAFDFCNNQETLDTTAIITGSEKYVYYMITPVGSSVQNGQTQTFEITRDDSSSAGIINFVVWLEPSDTARVVGITTGLNSGGDLTRDNTLSSSDYAQDPRNPNRALPITNNIVISKRVIFSQNERRKTITVPTLTSSPPTSTTSEVTYTAGLFRSTEDLNDNRYPDTHVPNTSTALNTVRGRITFTLPTTVTSGLTTTVVPPTITAVSLNYSSQSQSVLAGSPVVFTISRIPTTADPSSIRVDTIPDTAQDGIHYTGGQAVLNYTTGQTTASFSVNTLPSNTITNTAVRFKVRLVDVSVPAGLSTNLGGVGTINGTTIGSGITYDATITYGSPTASGSTASGTTISVVPLCPADIIVTSPPPTCIIQPDTQDLYLGLIARTTVNGYTLNYQWQRTYNSASGWTDVTDGLRSEPVNQIVTNFSLITTVTYSGVNIPVSGWTTSTVTVTGRTTYAGSTTNQLSFRPSYLLNDEEYYRCIITATPSITTGLVTLSSVTTPTYLGVTSSGVFLSSVNCGPPRTLSGATIVYSGTTPTVGGPTLASGVVCVTPLQPLPITSSGVTVVISGATTVSGTTSSTTSGITIPTNPSGPRIVPVIDPTIRGPVTAPVVVDQRGGVVSITIPENLPRYRSIPLIPIIGAGAGATARAQLDENGKLTNIIVNSKGFGYKPNISTSGCGILDNIKINIVGGYFESSPTVYVDDDPDIAVAAINDAGQVVEIRIVNPKNKVYDTIPRIDIIGDGYGAAATAVIRYVDCDEVANEYLRIVNKYSTSTIGTVKVEDCP